MTSAQLFSDQKWGDGQEKVESHWYKQTPCLKRSRAQTGPASSFYLFISFWNTNHTWVTPAWIYGILEYDGFCELLLLIKHIFGKHILKWETSERYNLLFCERGMCKIIFWNNSNLYSNINFNLFCNLNIEINLRKHLFSNLDV